MCRVTMYERILRIGVREGEEVPVPVPVQRARALPSKAVVVGRRT